MSGVLPTDVAALAAALPDVPCWLYARSVLLSGAARMIGNDGSDAVLVLDPTAAVLAGRPDPQLLRRTLAGTPSATALLVQEDALSAVRAALPGWAARPFVVHTRPRPYSSYVPLAPGVVVSTPLDPAVLAGLPDDVRADAADAPAAAVRYVDGVPVAVCAVSDLTGVALGRRDRHRCGGSPPRTRHGRLLRAGSGDGGARPAAGCGRRTKTTSRRWHWRHGSASSQSHEWPNWSRPNTPGSSSRTRGL